MPVIKSAKKKARQAKRHEERNKGLRTRVKTTMKRMLTLSKTDAEGAKKFMPEAYSVIDTACKKHLLHPNNAARKKSLLARQLAGAKTATPLAKAAKAEPKKAVAEKKVEAKEVETKEA